MATTVYLVKKEYKAGKRVACNWKWGQTTKDDPKKRSRQYVECFRWQELPTQEHAYRFEESVTDLLWEILRAEGIKWIGVRAVRWGGRMTFRNDGANQEEISSSIDFCLVMAAWDVCFEFIAAQAIDPINYRRARCELVPKVYALAALYRDARQSVPEPMWA